LPVINNEDQINCDKPISEVECLSQYQLGYISAHNKSPGLDGFSVEFYKTYWNWNDIKGIVFRFFLKFFFMVEELCPMYSV